jgi:glycosyltransferase involved in cell wall biosynthesis
MRVFFTYKHIDQPWGGANNFIRALHGELACVKYEFVKTIESNCDIIFMNQLGTGPGSKGKDISINFLKKLKSKKRSAPKIVVRAVNLNWHAHRHGVRNIILGRWKDRQTLKLLNMADVVIFQSAYQRDFFIESGYGMKNENVVIHNGASDSFWCESPSYVEPKGVLKLISSTASSRKTKRHDLIAKISMLKGVEVSHLGGWPDDVEVGNVKLLGMRSRDEMAAEMKNHHYFLHTAIKDPCPNAIFEAISMGLPVIYNPDIGSSAEIVNGNGLPLNESDLDSTIDLAFSNLKSLREMILNNRDNYFVSRATREYKEVFEKLLS